MANGLGGELLWLCPTLGGDNVDLTALNTPSVDGGLVSIPHTDHGGTRAYSFDGTNDCIIVPHDSRFSFGTGDFCISLHCKPTTAGSADLVHKILSSDTFAGFTAQRVSGSSRLWIYNVGSTPHQSRSITINVWSHLIFQRVVGLMTVWVNGKCVADTPSTLSVNNTETLKIGSLAAGGWNGGWFAGLMDDIRIFNRELTPLERGQLGKPGFQPSGIGTAGFTGIRGVSKRLGT